MGVWTEREIGHGDDAEPLLLHQVRRDEGLIGVFDGSGGSGAATAYRSGDGVDRSGAWVGSRVARAAVESWFCAQLRAGCSFEPESLRVHLGTMLGQMRPATRSKISGSARRELPTTVAVARYQRREHVVTCQILWAGDSRVYLLTPGAGLQALSRDHTVETDALHQLLQDPPMTNVASADRDFYIDCAELVVDTPCVLLCATDGFFGYVDTPADLEVHLLQALRDSASELEWAKGLVGRVRSYTGDDASLSLVGLGFPGFAALRDQFAERTSVVFDRYAPGAHRDVASRGDPEFGRWRDEAWAAYRYGYERLMPPPRTEVR
ncbi:hypothetical protein CC117_30225 [Parafrankia colletiae]|uniref:PPM-type phosphatase domain-containing protein n=1 Tax=Parafrankia colletiae TaxID=573497 RepID=A0A1S1Q3V0_9ACTN|nr:hypothetical protein CC117_30225 [Parafrankia colletiae]